MSIETQILDLINVRSLKIFNFLNFLKFNTNTQTENQFGWWKEMQEFDEGDGVDTVQTFETRRDVEIRSFEKDVTDDIE